MQLGAVWCAVCLSSRSDPMMATLEGLEGNRQLQIHLEPPKHLHWRDLLLGLVLKF